MKFEKPRTNKQLQAEERNRERREDEKDARKLSSKLRSELTLPTKVVAADTLYKTLFAAAKRAAFAISVGDQKALAIGEAVAAAYEYNEKHPYCTIERLVDFTRQHVFKAEHRLRLQTEVVSNEEYDPLNPSADTVLDFGGELPVYTIENELIARIDHERRMVRVRRILGPDFGFFWVYDEFHRHTTAERKKMQRLREKVRSRLGK